MRRRARSATTPRPLPRPGSGRARAHRLAAAAAVLCLSVGSADATAAAGQVVGVAPRSTATGTTTTVPAPARAAAPTTVAPPTTTPPVADEVPDEVPASGLALADQTDWVAAGEPFDLRVSLPEDLPADAGLVVEVHAPITSRSQFTATLGGALLGARRASVTVPLGELGVAPDGSRSVRLTQGPTAAPGERAIPVLDRPGVYPVVVSVRPVDPASAPPAPLTTYLVRTPEESTPLRVAVVQPVDAPLLHGADGDVGDTAEGVGDLLSLAEVLAASAPMPLTIAPGPETLDALDELADADDAAAGALEALAAATEGRQVVSAPYVDVDVDALEAAGLGEDLAAQRRRGDEAVEAVLGVRTDPRTSVLGGGASGASLRRLATLGVDQVVLPDAALSPVSLRLSLTRPFSVAADGQGGVEIEATAPDPALAARYGSDDPVLAAQHLLADLAVLHGDEPGPLQPRGVVVAPPDEIDVDPAFLAHLLDGIGTSPTLEPVTLDTYFRDVVREGDQVPLVRVVTPSGGTLGIGGGEVEAARSRLTGYASMVVSQDAAVQDLYDLTLLAEAEGLEPAERRAYLGGVGRAIDARIGRVDVVEADFRLPDSEGTIPLTLVRDGSTPLQVRVTLESERLEFGSGDERSVGRRAYDDIELTSENTPLVVPVHVRSPGTFPLFVTITSPDGRLELARSEVTIRSTAYSGVGVALSVGAGLFLLLWWGRHWRTVRRARRLVPVA